MVAKPKPKPKCTLRSVESQAYDPWNARPLAADHPVVVRRHPEPGDLLMMLKSEGELRAIRKAMMQDWEPDTEETIRAWARMSMEMTGFDATEILLDWNRTRDCCD